MATLDIMIKPKKKKVEMVETEIGTKVPAAKQAAWEASMAKDLDATVPTPAQLKASVEEAAKKRAMKAAMLKRAMTKGE